MAENKQPILQKITLTNLLSFGPDPVTLELRNLNVLIGPNGSGKSNLIEAISLLPAAAYAGSASKYDLSGTIRQGGGAAQWIWKGQPENLASVYISMVPPGFEETITHRFAFQERGDSFTVAEEVIEGGPWGQVLSPYYRGGGFGPRWVRTLEDAQRQLNDEDFDPSTSVLAQLRDGDAYPEIRLLARFYERFRIYREWNFGRKNTVRQPYQSDGRNDRLADDFSNLGLVLSRYRRFPHTKAMILAGLRDLYADFDDFDVIVEGGFVQVYFTEGAYSIPATRLSDGTLRYLCLLTVLCDPQPPPLICIEEPELGFHPDMLPKLAKLLVDASSRTQLIVTTHSDILVDAMTEQPESIVVCEKQDGKTTMRRLDKNDLGDWLERYRLGEMWSRGMIGGNRW